MDLLAPLVWHRWGNEKTCGISVGKCMRRGHLEDLSIDVMLLKRILEKDHYHTVM